MATKQSVIMMCLVEVVFEAFPQAALQLYIAAQSNLFDPLLVVSIASSVLSVINGMTKGLWAFLELREEWENGVLFSILYGFWLLLHFVSFVIPLAFFSSLK